MYLAIEVFNSVLIFSMNLCEQLSAQPYKANIPSCQLLKLLFKLMKNFPVDFSGWHGSGTLALNVWQHPATRCIGGGVSERPTCKTAADNEALWL